MRNAVKGQVVNHRGVDPVQFGKMAAGKPLDDSDRDPWLASIRVHITATIARGESAVVTCSALKESYRRLIIGRSRSVKLVHLHGDPVLIRQRIAARKGHFMKPAMLDSQLADLEPPRDALLVLLFSTAIPSTSTSL